MRGTPLLPIAGLLTALAAGVAAGAEPATVRFVAPKAGQIVVGETVFEVAVAAARPRVDRVDVYCGGALIGVARAPAWRFVAEVAPRDMGAPLVAVAFAEGSAVGRAEIRPPRIEGLGESVEVSRVQLFPVVLDRDGKPAPGLGKDDFELRVEGERVPIAGFSPKASAPTIALALDASGSMADRLALIEAAARRFLGRLDAEDVAALYTFNENTRLLLPPTADHEAARKALEGLAAGGSTALHDAAIEVIGDLSRVKTRKAMVLFSDGRDERSVASLDEVVEAARRADVLIYTIGAIPVGDPDEGRRDLRQLAEESGGRAFELERLAELGSVFEAIRADLSAQYALAFAPPKGKPGTKRIDLRTKDGRFTVRARTQYHQD